MVDFLLFMEGVEANALKISVYVTELRTHIMIYQVYLHFIKVKVIEVYP